MLTQDDHRWCRERMAAYEAGLLSCSPEEDRFAGHLRSCSACQESLRRFQGGELSAATPDPAVTGQAAAEDGDALVEQAGSWEHVPESILARWPQSRRRLRGIERAMVRAHLERCETCRADLELLGHTPALEEELPASSAPNPDRPRLVRLWQSPWARWGVVGWAAAATVALAIMLYQGGLTPPQGQANRRESAGAPEFPGASAELAPVLSLSVQRGGEPRTTLIPSGTRALIVGGPDFPTAGSYVIEVFGPGGGRVLRQILQAAPGDGVVLRQPRPWEPGLYKILLHRIASEGEPPSTVTFVLRLQVDN